MWVTATSNTPKPPPSKRQSQNDYAENCGSHQTLYLRSEFILPNPTSHGICDESDDYPPSKSLSKSFAQWGQISDDATPRDDDKKHARRTQSNPHTPTINENPSLRIREKTKHTCVKTGSLLPKGQADLTKTHRIGHDPKRTSIPDMGIQSLPWRFATSVRLPRKKVLRDGEPTLQPPALIWQLGAQELQRRCVVFGIVNFTSNLQICK